jgi:histidyl-tRNA synthetase
MAAKFQAPRGTFDVLPAQSRARARVHAVAAAVFERAGYGRIETPAFEDTELFARGVGETTDIVQKEMFTFDDLGGRSITLRPEGTAPIARAYVEHGMHKLAQPVKLWYRGPFFRYEAPQAGRYRQFSQIGAEALGSDSPLVDAEAVMLLDDILRELGVPGLRLQLSSLGSPRSRAAYREELQAYLRAHQGELAPEARERIDANPMRAFDSKDERTGAVMAAAPKLLDRLADEDASHLAEVRALLDAAGIEYELDPTLVRGLDYYTRTVFAFTAEGLGAQSEVGGGGRYDGLVEQLGGPPTPAMGWAAGVERILLALGEEEDEPGRDVFVAAAEESGRGRAMALVGELRRAGVSAELDLGGRGLKGQLKHADRIGARQTVIIEADGSAQIRDMQSGEQRPADAARLIEELGTSLAASEGST